MSLKTSSGVFSSLLFNQIHSSNDQEGFLLGEIHVESTTTISDADISQKKELITYDVQQVVPCPSVRYFYDKKGVIIDDRVQELFDPLKSKSIIGWYKSRQNTLQEMTFWEKIVHKNLTRRILKTATKGLVFGLFSTESRDNSRIFQHRFLKYQNGVWTCLALHVENLGSTSANYKAVPLSSSTISSYFAVTNNYRDTFVNSSGQAYLTSQVDDLASRTLLQLKELSEEVQRSERDIKRLEHEADQVRHALCQAFSIQGTAECSQKGSAGSSQSAQHGDNSSVLTGQDGQEADLIDLATDLVAGDTTSESTSSKDTACKRTPVQHDERTHQEGLQEPLQVLNGSDCTLPQNALIVDKDEEDVTEVKDREDNKNLNRDSRIRKGSGNRPSKERSSKSGTSFEGSPGSPVY